MNPKLISLHTTCDATNPTPPAPHTLHVTPHFCLAKNSANLPNRYSALC